MPEHPAPHPDLGGYVLGTLTSEEVDAFRLHLEECEHCRVEVDDLRGLPGLLDIAAPPLEEPPVPLPASTRDAVRSRMRAGRARRRVAQVVVAAAAVAIVATASLWLARDPAPRSLAIDLVPTAQASAAQGLARLEPGETGVRVRLELEGLASPPEGAHYECWYVSEHDTPDQPDRVSAGTFTVPGPGNVSVTMATAADPRRFNAIVVTLERDGGDPAPGETVLFSENWKPLRS